jgi:proline dehydrogenase
MEEALPVVLAIRERGMRVSLDFLGESVHSHEEATRFVDYYLRLIRFIEEKQVKTGVSLKLTQLGMDIGDDLALENMRVILAEAQPRGIFVRMDMEGSPYTARTLDLYRKLLPDFKNTGVVLQAYLHRTRADLDQLIAEGAFIRMVKGAYKESDSIAFPEKEKVNSEFVFLMREMLSKGKYPAIATHDPAMIDASKQAASEFGVSKEGFEFQMLYGIRRDLQDSLQKEGYRMRVYTPFGTHWYPYMMRRLAERPGNLWFVMKNMLRK